MPILSFFNSDLSYDCDTPQAIKDHLAKFPLLTSLFFIYGFVLLMSKLLKMLSGWKHNSRKKDIPIEFKDRRGKAPDLETVSAILMALHMSAELKKEEEKAILTIGKIIRPYSPWSSKIYNMKNQPWTTTKR